MPGQIIALLVGDPITLRSADSPPLVLPALSIADAFDMVLSTQMSAVPGLEAAAPGLLLYAGHDEWQAHQHTIDQLRDRFTGVKVQLLPGGPLSVLAPAAAAGDAVNLLQGALAVASPAEMSWRSWRVAAVLAGVLLCLHLGVRFYELSKLKAAETQLNASIEDAFRAAMPGQTNAVNARSRVAARLEDLRTGGGGTLLPALVAIAQTRDAAPGVTIEGFTYRNGVLTIRVMAADTPSIDAVGQQLRAANWAAELKGVTSAGDGYRGSLEIRKAGA
jgi:type II secretion system protein L